MQFVLLIYQGTTPTPTSEAWTTTFSDEEKKQIHTELQRNQYLTWGYTWPSARASAGGNDLAGGGWQNPRNEGLLPWRSGMRWWVPRARGRKPRRRHQARGANSGGSSGRCDRGPAGREVLVVGNRGACEQGSDE